MLNNLILCFVLWFQLTVFSPHLFGSVCHVTIKATDLLGNTIESKWLRLFLSDYKIRQDKEIALDQKGSFYVNEGEYLMRLTASGASEYSNIVGFSNCKSRPNQIVKVGLVFAGETSSERRTIVIRWNGTRKAQVPHVALMSVFGTMSLLPTYTSESEVRLYQVPLGAYWLVLNTLSSDVEIFRVVLAGEDQGEAVLKEGLRLTWHTDSKKKR